MKSFSLIIFLSFIFTMISLHVSAQGCVAIRSNGAVCTMEHAVQSDSAAKSWQLNTGYRYFRSFRHFKGKEEQPERLAQGTEVINYQHSLDFTLLKHLNSRWSVAVGLPLVFNERSSLYEHGRKERHMSGSYGLGDMRLLAYRWMIDPAKMTKFNFQLALGAKLPTGKYDYQDYFYNVGPEGQRQLRPVDQSIQPGDGGFGAISELNAFYSATPALGLYANLFYLVNPREVNGTRTYRETLSPILANEAIMSVPDQYMVRFGVNYMPHGRFRNVSASLGSRLEGIPVYDLVGGSKGFRRPGYIWSMEPGLNYRFKKSVFFVSVPVATVRNRTQSVTDKETTRISGTFRQGDAAFADYSLNFGYSIKF